MKSLKSLLLTFFIAISFGDIYAQNSEVQGENLLYVTDIAWSHDGSKIVAAGIEPSTTQGYLSILNAQTGDEIYHLNPIPGGFSSVAWSPDDRFIAAGGYDQVIWVIDVKTQTHVASLGGHQATITAVDWNTDGTQLISSGNWDQLVILWDMTTYNEIRRVEVVDPWAVDFSPDGQRIAVGGASGLSVFSSTLEINDKIHQHKWADGFIGSVAWSPDGKRIAFGTQTFPNLVSSNNQSFAEIYVLDSNNHTQLMNLPTEDEAIFGLVWSADNTLLASQSINGFIRVWDANSGELLESFSDNYTGQIRYPEQIAFSPYGGRLAYGGTLSLNTSSTPSPSERDAIQSLAGGVVQIIVPAPSLERLNTIMQQCGLENTVLETLQSDITHDQLADFIQKVEQLKSDNILPACAADLIAVAEALQAEQ